MAPIAMIQAYVEKLVAEMLELDGPLAVDKDGSIPVRRGSALYYIDVIDRGDSPHLVRVWSIVLRNVAGGRQLLKALNSINGRILQAKVFLTDEGKVIMSTELLADTVTVANLSYACDAIGDLADRFDDELQADFSGEKSFEDDEDAVSV
ncbi:T3SS (YopN, CesT) and YbjN peptide-binding chaperone 1 [Actinocorallia sp. A-T 12471]|uniref:T3SS (YopN, CesT) and YbjN peptide-binding chaperone 1 n=1 Tax=Actinocorallia sp. A-T 12471 TaxID=3089813 RepID=UPI0029D017F8|nr:YbjN domain-containing protein [Actinocorallia sp. A-T 12471]MDX6738687.1 YbjN domain-containing protein [Actinocorallia sp. A-T 12471]